MAVSHELLARARQGRVTVLMASSDLKRAFDTMGQTLQEEAVLARLLDQGAVLRVLRKSGWVIYRLRQRAAVSELETPWASLWEMC